MWIRVSLLRPSAEMSARARAERQSAAHPKVQAWSWIHPHVCTRRKRIPACSCSSLVVRDERSGEAGQGRVRPGEAFHVETPLFTSSGIFRKLPRCDCVLAANAPL